jgi:hypothetical protein
MFERGVWEYKFINEELIVMEKIRKIIRELVESEVFNEGKK